MKASLRLHCGMRKVEITSAPVPANCFQIRFVFDFQQPKLYGLHLLRLPLDQDLLPAAGVRGQEAALHGAR